MNSVCACVALFPGSSPAFFHSMQQKAGEEPGNEAVCVQKCMCFVCRHVHACVKYVCVYVHVCCVCVCVCVGVRVGVRVCVWVCGHACVLYAGHVYVCVKYVCVYVHVSCVCVLEGTILWVTTETCIKT